jgi:hypothetical protein
MLNADCHWYIESAIGTRVMLDFTSVRTERKKDEVSGGGGRKMVEEDCQ